LSKYSIYNAQLNKHLPSKFLVRLRLFVAAMRGVDLKADTIVYKGVELLRYPKNISLGSQVVVKTGAHICPCNKAARIVIGDRSTIGFYSMIYSSKSVYIGSDCMIAPFVSIVDSNHGTDRSKPMNRQPNSSKEIHISDDVWIGTHAVVLAGVSIGKGAIVAAGAIVREDVEPYTIVGGVPAKIIGERT
jgi:acetyltransferase-like isoleucine patch superfamily enzyme